MVKEKKPITKKHRKARVLDENAIDKTRRNLGLGGDDRLVESVSFMLFPKVK